MRLPASQSQHRRPSPLTLPITLLLLTLTLLTTLPVVSAGLWSHSLSYCKCICFSNSTIIPLHLPDDPSKPCSSCTRQFCVDQKLAICKGAQVPELDTDVGTGTEGDVEARCFQRDSPRDQAIVTLFLLTVCALLLYAGVRTKLRKAIEDRGQPTDLREWGEALLPTSLVEYTRAREMRTAAGTYERVTVG